MKKAFLIIYICCIAIPVSAQLKLDMVLNATPPATLTEWGSRREVLTALITGQPGLPPAAVKIKAEVKTTDGTVVGTTDLARSATFVVGGSAPTIYTAAEVMPLENMIFTGKYKTSLQKSGKLPSDNYMLCVQLVRPADLAPMSNQVCKNFYLAATQLPILMKPANEEVLDANVAQTAITFRWTPALPRTNTPVTYRLQVFEVLEHQSPVQALRSNQPLLDQEVLGITQFIWRPQISFLPAFTENEMEGSMPRHNKTKTIEPGQDSAAQKNINTSEANLGSGHNKTKNINTSEDNLGSGHNMMLIWTIQTLDDHGLPVTQSDGSGEARSEPSVFTVRMKAKERMNR